MPETETIQPIEYKLRIEFFCLKNRKFFNKIDNVIQNKPFKFGLKITNICDKACPKGKLKSLSIKSGVGGTIVHTDEVELAFQELNPRQETIIMWPNLQKIIMKEEVWIDCIIEPEDKSISKFVTF